MVRWQPDAPARLQQAALALYGERGFEETTVAEIAERAGLTKRTFFRYFADKREVLFRGSEVLENQMVSAIADAPAGAPALALIAAALDAAAARFEPVREFAIPRHRIIAASPELQERELIKLASLTTALTQALRARGLAGSGAALTANMAVGLMHVTFEQWVAQANRETFQSLARQALAQLREIVSAASVESAR